MAVKFTSIGGRMARARARQALFVKRRYASPFDNARTRPLWKSRFTMSPMKRAARQSTSTVFS